MAATYLRRMARVTRIEAALAGLTAARRGDPQTEARLARLRQDPTRVMTAAGLTPDPWQARLLRSTAPRVLLLATRQGGKSQAAAALALLTALLEAPALVLILSPSERQSGELAAKVFDYYDRLGQPVPARKRTELQLCLASGSRVIALPDSERTIRGYSGAKLLIVDEASRVSDDLYRTVRPMLAVSRGRLIALTTPFGRRGFFHDAWENGGREWQRFKVTADQCPRITPQFLEEERRSMGERWWRQEYHCSYEAEIDCVFSPADIEAAWSHAVQPW